MDWPPPLPETKLRLYKLSVCSSLTHCCTAWALTRTVTRMINGFNSRCLHVVITGDDYRATATTPVYDLMLAVRKRSMRALPRPRTAPVPGQDSATLPRRSCEGRNLLTREQPIFSDCEVDYLYELIETATNRSDWRAKNRWRDNNSGWSVGLQPLIYVVSCDPLGLIWINIYNI